MSTQFDVFRMFMELEAEARDACHFEAKQVYGTAVDLWDGMLKGRTGSELQTAVTSFISAMESNRLRAHDPLASEALAYEMISEFAKAFLGEISS